MALNVAQTVVAVAGQLCSVVPLPGLILAASLLKEAIFEVQNATFQKSQAECIADLLDRIIPIIEEKVNGHGSRAPRSLLDSVEKLTSILDKILKELTDLLHHGLLWRICHKDRLALALSRYYSEIITEFQLFSFKADIDMAVDREADRKAREADSRKIHQIYSQIMEGSLSPSDLVQTDASGMPNPEKMHEVAQECDAFRATLIPGSLEEKALAVAIRRLELMSASRGTSVAISNWTERSHMGPDIEVASRPSPPSTNCSNSPISPVFIPYMPSREGSVSSASSDADSSTVGFDYAEGFDCGSGAVGSYVTLAESLFSPSRPSERSPSPCSTLVSGTETAFDAKARPDKVTKSTLKLSCLPLTAVMPSWDPLTGTNVQVPSHLGGEDSRGLHHEDHEVGSNLQGAVPTAIRTPQVPLGRTNDGSNSSSSSLEYMPGEALDECIQMPARPDMRVSAQTVTRDHISSPPLESMLEEALNECIQMPANPVAGKGQRKQTEYKAASKSISYPPTLEVDSGYGGRKQDPHPHALFPKICLDRFSGKVVGAGQQLGRAMGDMVKKPLIRSESPASPRNSSNPTDSVRKGSTWFAQRFTPTRLFSRDPASAPSRMELNVFGN